MRTAGCRRVALVDDAEIFGRALTGWAARAGRRIGLNVVATPAIDARARGYRKLVRHLRHRRARCVAFGGITASNAVQLFRDLARGFPRAKLLSGDGIANAAFLDPRDGGVPARVGRRVRILSSARPASALTPAAQDVVRRYTARYGDPDPDPSAVYGYEAMRLVLDAAAATGGDRAAAVRFLHAMPERDGPAGRYRFDRFGDTTTRTFGVYRIAGGGLRFARRVEAP
jgi:branched-chain amino acid transport system substrate-binding protein